MKRIIRGVLIGALIVVVATIPILAQYYIFLDVTESDGTSYTFLPIMATLNTTHLISEGYIASNGSDTRVTDLEYAVLPHLWADDRVLWCGNVTGSATTQFILWTEQDTISSFPVITGYGGYVVTSDNATIEMGDIYMIQYVGYLDMSQTTGSVFWKEGACSLNRTGTQELTYSVVGGNSLVASSLPSGYHTVAIYNDGVNMWIDVDGTQVDINPASAVPDTANDWYLFMNYISPYVYYFDAWVVTT